MNNRRLSSRRVRSVSTFDVANLWSMHRERRLLLRPEFQRNAIWPAAAKSYLIDTLLRGLPIPLIFAYRMSSADTGRPGIAVIDGQQRLSAIFDFLEGTFRLSGPDVKTLWRKSFDDLTSDQRTTILSYGMAVEVLEGYSQAELRDIYVRLNKYGVRLSPQELRHAKAKGAFNRVMREVGSWDFWTAEGIIGQAKVKRMRTEEFAAELLILLAEAGPQDKKGVVDQYLIAYEESFPNGQLLERRLHKYVDWARVALEHSETRQFRRATDFYSLMGALDRVSERGGRLASIDPAVAGRALRDFGIQLREDLPPPAASRYQVAARNVAHRGCPEVVERGRTRQRVARRLPAPGGFGPGDPRRHATTVIR